MGRPRKKADEKKKTILLSFNTANYEKFQQIAYVKQISLSEIVTDWLSGYIEQNENILQEYEELTKNKNDNEI